jgi:predicted O-linked N-acetylglucosamine transferase (SPINDLY family)
MDGFGGSPAAAGGWAGLQTACFEQVVQAVEQIGANRGAPEAIALYRNWIALQLDATPLLHAAWFNLGVELSRAGLGLDAVVAYRQALALKPDFYSASINLGLALEQCGDTEAALRCWSQALQPDEARVALINHRARVLEQTGRFHEAEQALRQSLLTDPDQPNAVQHWVHLRQKMCAWPVLDASIPGLTHSRLVEQCGPLAALALTDDIAVQGSAGASWVARRTVPAGECLSPAAGYKHQQVRVGYLSSDFCRHALSFLIAELFERHDRNRFEVFGYCASPEDGSDVRARVIAAFDHFRPIRALDDEAAARLIRNDEIDILVDLNGLTAGSRVQILRWRPAPVQATYLGFVGPVPLPELDYLFCDDFVIPPELAGLYQPTPLPIAPLYQAVDSKSCAASMPLRRDIGLPDGRFVFASFANHYKITETHFALWMAILRRTNDSVLWLAGDNAWSENNLRASAAAQGVDAARLIFTPRAAPADYRARLSLADLFLDTFPYTAGTVASDVIRAGLPVVTLLGQAFASRMAARLLREIGADQGIALTPEAYVETAVKLARDPAAYAGYRAHFSEERWVATIGDMARFTAAYEATLLRIRKGGV